MWWLWALVLCACGRIDFNARSDAASAVDSTVDTPDAMLGEFTTATPIAALNVQFAFEGDPTMSVDELEILFKSNRGAADFDIWTSTRPATDQPWLAPTKVTELSQAGSDDTGPELSPDELTIWLTRGAPGDIFVATRSARGQPWSTPVPVSEFNTPGIEKGIETRDPAQLVGYLTELRTSENHVYRTTRASTASPWSAPTVVELFGDGNDENPTTSSDDRYIVFGSDRTGSLAEDLYLAHRPSPGAPFDPPMNLSAINASGLDDDPWLSPDQRTIMFTSNRSGDPDLYEAHR